jgi:hypothetical protein
MTATAVPTTFLPLRYLVPEVTERLRAELGDAGAVIELVDGLLEIDLPSPVPSDAAGSTLDVWDVVGVTELTTRFDGMRLILDGVLDVLPGYEPQFPIPGFDKLSIVVAQLGRVHVELAIDDAWLEVTGPSIALRFDPEWLGPIAAEDPGAFAEIEIVELGYLVVDSAGSIEFGAVRGGTLRFVTNNDPWRIGDSSITLEAGELDVVLREGPEGGPAVTLTDAVLRFSEDLAAKDGTGFELALAGARIDPTGFSGTVSAMFPDTAVDDPQRPTTFVGSGAASLFGFEFGVSSIDIEFRSNLPVRCAIGGGMILPFFEEAVTCTLGLGEDGDFRVAFADVDGDGLVQFTKEDVCRLALTAFEFARADEITTLSLSGDIELLRPPGELPTVPSLTVRNLKITSSGEVSLEAGWIELNPAVTLDFIGFLLTIEKLGIGFDPSLFWVGITGGITLINGLPRATVEELRLLFPLPSGAPSVALRGATIDADIGGAIQLFGGFRLLPEDEGVQGFAGDVRLTLSAGFGLDGSLLVGIHTVENYPFLYVFIGVELPAGIPLGPTGCAIFGCAGLFGFNVTPNREPDENWYYDWYSGPPGPGATQSTKWRPQKDAFAFGAGITIGTQDGFTIVVRALLVITLPSFTIMIEGRSGFLTERSKLGENPPLRALVIFDPADGILIAVEAQYEFVANVLFAHGLVEGYFPFHSGAWHVYLGEEPAERRIAADVLKKLFRADAYVMIDGSKTQFGGGIGYALDRRFGPVAVRVAAGLSGAGTFSYEPTQLEASLALFGSLRLSAFGFSIGAELDAGITVRVPTPFLLSMHFAARLNLCWPLDDVKIEFDVRWEERIPPPYPAPLLAEAGALFNVSSDTIALTPGQIAENVPLDARFALNFAHALSRPAPGDYPRLLNFAETYLHRVSPSDTFRYNLASLRLEQLDDSGAVEETFDFDESSSPLFGHWQITPAGEQAGSGPAPADSSRAPGGTLLLFARTPFEYLQGTWTQNDGTTPPADIPDYEPVPEEPPSTSDIDLCDEIASPPDLSGGWLPGHGETAAGTPDPAAPTETVTSDGVVIVVHGFPEPAGEPGPTGDGGLIDPTGGPFQVDVEFPGPVVVTGTTVDPGPGGDTTVTLDGEPATDPQVPGTSSEPQPTDGGEEPCDTEPEKPTKLPWWCCVLSLLGILAVVGAVAAYAFGAFQPFIRPRPIVTLFVILLATIVIVLLCGCACDCGWRRKLLRSWMHRRDPDAARQPAVVAAEPTVAPPPTQRRSPALDLLRRLARRRTPGEEAGQPRQAVRAVRVPAAAAASRQVASAAVSMAPLPGGLMADRISIRGTRISCGSITYVDGAVWRAYAQALDVNAMRAAERTAYGTMAYETLTDDAFILRPDSHYRLRLSVVKSGGASDSVESHDTATTDREFRTQPAPPSDLRPYVLEAVPTDSQAPLFREEETGVRFIETYLQQMYARAAGLTLSIRIQDTNGVVVSGRRTEWRKAEDHVDRTGQLSYLTRVNEIYEAGIAASSMLRDDILVSLPEAAGSGVLPGSVTLEAAIVASGPGAPAEPLFSYRFRTSRYHNAAAWAAAMPATAGEFVDSGLPDGLWANTEPLPISEEALLPLFKEALPDTPLLRRMSRSGKPPVLILTFPEPLPRTHVEFVLWEPAVAISRRTSRSLHRQERSSYQVAFESEYLVPLSRYSGTPVPNGSANPVTRLRTERYERSVAELALVPGPVQAREVPTTTVWVEDGSRAFLVPTDAAERVASAAYDLEIRYAHPIPDAGGNRVVETATARVEIPVA